MYIYIYIYIYIAAQTVLVLALARGRLVHAIPLSHLRTDPKNKKKRDVWVVAVRV